MSNQIEADELMTEGELCDELTDILSRAPDTVEITIKIPLSGDLDATTVTDDEIEQMAAGDLFVYRRQARIGQDE